MTAAGARKIKGKEGACPALGRSRGGLRTKINAASDALGLVVRLIASPGQRDDIAHGHEQIEGFEPAALLADEVYDAGRPCGCDRDHRH